MSKQLFETLLASLKRSNKVRRQNLAVKAGYANYEEYKTYLEGMIGAGKKPNKKTKKSTNTIHIVDIIDCSGSMSGGKISNAVKGINEGIDELSKDKSGATHTYTLCNFSGSSDIQFDYIVAPLKIVKKVRFSPRGMTALYDAIGTTIKKVQENIKKGDKVLVNIYTDGGENGSARFNSESVGELIENLKGTFTVTFIGTQRDTELVISKLNIDSSNTLAYDGSASGLGKTLQKTRSARAVYSKAVVAGENVATGFYKNIN